MCSGCGHLRPGVVGLSVVFLCHYGLCSNALIDQMSGWMAMKCPSLVPWMSVRLGVFVVPLETLTFLAPQGSKAAFVALGLCLFGCAGAPVGPPMIQDGTAELHCFPLLDPEAARESVDSSVRQCHQDKHDLLISDRRNC